jgi:dipeptidyl aminopeptidase/acylaminoacyl peptidase
MPSIRRFGRPTRGASVSLVLLALLAAVSPSLAAPRAPSRPGNPWTIDDILLAEEARSFRISPDSEWAVWVKARMDPDAGEEVASLMLSRLGGAREEITLTRGRSRDSDPKWSPDGKTIAFLSTRSLPPAPGEASQQEAEEDEEDEGLAETQLWLIRAGGGEPWPITRLDRGIVGFDWRGKDTIVIAAPEAKSLHQQQVAEDDDTSVVVEAPTTPPVRLFAVDVTSGALTRLTENADWIEWVKVSPDGRYALARHAQSLSFEFDQRVLPVLELHDLGSGTTRTLLEGQRVLASSAEWAPDSKGFYFVQPYSSDPRYFVATVQRLQYVDAASGQASPVDLQWPRGLSDARILPTLDGFLALLADGVRYRPARYTRSGGGWTRQELTGEHAASIFDWALGPDGRTLVYERSTASLPTQWYQAVLNGAAIEGPSMLTSLNPGFKGKKVHSTEVVHWAGAGGDEVEGILYYPLDYERGRRYPLVLSIHGGPTDADRDRWIQGWDYPKILIAQKGAFLLEVNYHGSASYGLEWAESICCGKYYELPRIDLEKGVDFVIGRGQADPQKLASLGWSNGAILTTELITRSGRFKAASAGAGDVEWISDWANVDFGASFDNYYMGKAPYEDPELYVRESPYFRLKDVTTPTIVYTGTKDRNVPPSQSWSFFRVMQQATKTPVRFLLFPGEPHGLQQYVHQRRKVEEDLAWFDRYLFGQPAAEPVLKDDSPLAVALARKEAARAGGHYGRTVKGKLVPEGVRHGGLRVGRFEVTRAQYAAFDAKYRFAAGTEDYPASGITFEQAKAYAEWLAALTGEPWRLPRAEEAADLYPRPSASGSGGDDAAATENTLDRWAGYPPNPEDAARLREKAAALGGEAPLLEEVGRLPGRGDGEKVYDLGGNVAEWALGADGHGVLVGGSADQPAGATGPSAAAGPAYRGLRVVADGTAPASP